MSDITRHTECRQALAGIKQHIQALRTPAVLAVADEVVPQPAGQLPWAHGT